MGHNSHNHLLSFHLPHLGKKEATGGRTVVPPKGTVAVMIGVVGEEKQKFVVPVMSLTHPLFLSLLKEAEEEYGFDHKGVITIPCHVEYFRQVQDIIYHDKGGGGGSSNHGHHHHHHHHHHLPQLLTCFRA